MPIKPSTRPSPTNRLVIDGFVGGLHSEGVFTKTAILETECTSALNVEFYPVGVVAKRRGRINKHPNFGPVANTAIKKIYQWYNPSGAQYLLVFTCASGTVSGDVYSFTASAGDGSYTSALSASVGSAAWNPLYEEAISVISFTGSAVFVDGVDPMFAYDGTQIGQSITAAPTGVKYLASYRNTLFAANITDSGGQRRASRVKWSNPGDVSVWPAENYIDLDPDDGDVITGLSVLGSELMVFKEKKIYAITYVGGIYQYYAEIRVEDKGCAASQSIISQYGEILFYGLDAFYTFNGREIKDVSEKIKDYILNINPNARNFVYGEFYREKSQIWFLAPYLDSTRNNICFVYDRDRKSWTIYSNDAASVGFYNLVSDLIWDDMSEAWDTYDIAWGDRTFLSNANTVVTGSYNGYLYDNDTAGVTTDAGSAYSGLWRSKWLDFDEADFNKRIVRVTVLVNRELAHALTMNVYTNWNNDSIDSTFTIPLTASISSINVHEERVDFTKYCRAMQLEFTTSAVDTPFTIHKIIIEYIPKGRTKV